METLLALNADGTLCSRGNGRGFWRKPLLAGEKALSYKGVTRFIKTHVRGRGAAAARRVPVLRIPRTATLRPMPSSRKMGDHVHRHVMHQVVCAAIGCQCARVPTKQQQRSVTQTTRQFSNACVRAARSFAERYDLEPVSGELIVLHRTLAVGTRIDALFRRRTAPHALVVVSWKTGLGPRDASELRRHRVQLAFEWLTLQCSHQVANIECGFVVYLGAVRNTSTHRAISYFSEMIMHADEAATLYADFREHLVRKLEAKKKKKKQQKKKTAATSKKQTKKNKK